MILMVVDGQGGGIGATIVKRLRDAIGHELGILIPLTQKNVWVAGLSSEPLPHLVDQAAQIIKEM